MFCVHCGNKIEVGAKFCTHCGKATSPTSNESSSAANGSVATNDSMPTIKCENCGYAGPAKYARSTFGIVLAWVCIFFAPLITLIYFAVTRKYHCPKCQSTAIAIRNENGAFSQQRRNAATTLLLVLVGIAIVGILASIVLVALNSAREKARSSAVQNTTLNQ